MLMLTHCIYALTIAATVPDPTLNHASQIYVSATTGGALLNQHVVINPDTTGSSALVTQDLGSYNVALNLGALVHPHISLGGTLNFDGAFGDQDGTEKLSLGPSIGAIFSLAPNVYIWPKLSGGFAGSFTQPRTTSSQSTAGYGAFVGGEIPILVAFAGNFGVQFGPAVTYTFLEGKILGANVQQGTTLYGLSIGLVMWSQ